MLVREITDAGGKITSERFIVSAVFNEDTIGFWLDIYILIENLKKKLETSQEFYGYSLVLSGQAHETPELLSRFLANHNGVFVDEKAAKKLVPYAAFEKPSEWMEKIKKRKYGCGSFYRIKELKNFKPSVRNSQDLYDEITGIFEQEQNKNILLLGPSYWQLRGGMYKYCEKINDDFPSLAICFESIGIGSLIDSWSLNIRSLAAGPLTEEIDNLWEFLFRERIRDEISEYIIRCVKRFLHLVFNFYIEASVKREQKPVLMLENIHLAEKNILNLLLDTLSEFNQKSSQKLLILGTAEDDISTDTLKQIESIFDTVKNNINLKVDVVYYPKLSKDLWEIIYAISLFARYFSPEFFHRLFEEENKNPQMVTKAFSILHTLGIVNSLREPRLIKRHFEEYAGKILEEKTDRVKALVCRRILDWAVRRNISPCFRLLTVISNLDGIKKIDDLLFLKSISSDIVNKTTSTIETAMTSGQFDELISEKAAAIRHIYRTSMALNDGNENDIEDAFNSKKYENITDDCGAFPVFNAQILVNHCAYYLGRRVEKESAAKAKEAILLGQGKNSFCLPQAYRLYSLVCLSKKQVNETIEYLGFALSNAEKNGNYHELAVSAYYTAAAHFLYGDIFKSAKYAQKSIEQSLAAGRPDWADRSRFLEGRIKFELGHYQEAHDIFEMLNKEPFGSMTCEKENMLAAWIYRTKLYFLDPKTPKPDVANYDADLFEIEGAYLSRDYQKAVELSAAIKNPFADENFLYSEQADWRSGFAQCEHLYFTKGEIQSRMISLFHSLSLSRLSLQGSEEALQGIQQILRDEKLCEMDPWDAFYFYAKYRILEKSGASLVDMSTAVSMAFKRLQRRACRIEDIETRHQYLNGPRWNRELSLAAKEYKLI